MCPRLESDWRCETAAYAIHANGKTAAWLPVARQYHCCAHEIGGYARSTGIGAGFSMTPGIAFPSHAGECGRECDAMPASGFSWIFGGRARIGDVQAFRLLNRFGSEGAG